MPRVYVPRPPTEKPCIVCGELVTGRASRKTCSNKCRSYLRRRRKGTPARRAL